MKKFYLMFAMLLSLGLFVGCGGEVKPPAEDGAVDVETPAADAEEPAADAEEPAADAEEPAADAEEPAADAEPAPAADAEPAPPIDEPKVDTPEVEVTPPAEPAE